MGELKPVVMRKYEFEFRNMSNIDRSTFEFFLTTKILMNGISRRFFATSHLMELLEHRDFDARNTIDKPSIKKFKISRIFSLET